MVRNTWYFYLLILSILTVLLHVETSTSSGNHSEEINHAKLQADGTGILYNSQRSIDVPGFSLTNDEVQKFHIWPNGFIPYYIDVTSFSDKVLRDKIRSFLNMVNSITALNFVELPSPPEDDHTRWVFFINRKGLLGCADHSVWDFTSEGVQRVVLGYDCMNKEGELPEAVLAIAGVPAQHTAPDRDEYIEVFADNVMPDKRKLFEKLSDGDWLFHDLPYDYDSVGHYHNFKYSMNGKTVIQPRNPDITIGEAKGFSDIDIWKIRLLYNFITQKELLNVPECEKLFKKNSKMKGIIPNVVIPKPKQKPAKYTGIQPMQDNDVEYIDDENGFSDKKFVENGGDQGTEDYQENLSVENNKTKPEIITLSHSPENDDHGKKPLSLKNRIKKPKELKLKQVKQDLLLEVSDNQSAAIKHLKLKSDDPLEYLSDYSSGKEDIKKDKIAKEKQQTLKYVGMQLQQM